MEIKTLIIFFLPMLIIYLIFKFNLITLIIDKLSSLDFKTKNEIKNNKNKHVEF